MIERLNQIGYVLLNEIYNLTKRRKLGVKAVLYKNDLSVLLVRHNYKAKDKWYLPGGGILYGESPDAAIKREVREELGLVLQAIKLVGIYTGNGKYTGDINFLFTAKLRTKERLVLGSEIREAKYFYADDLPKKLAYGVRSKISDSATKLGINEEGIIWNKW